MSIRRGKHQENYAIIPNGTLNDDTLSFEARGLLAYLLAKPEDWTVRVADLCKQGGIGRDKCRALLATLEEAGYLIRERTRGEDGRLGEMDYVVFDEPNMQCEPRPENQDVVDPPRPEKPAPVKPAPVNQSHTKDRASTKDRGLQKTDPPQGDLLGDEKAPKRKRQLPPESPTEADREKAVKYWTEKGRPDLARAVIDIAQKFRAHHEARGSKMLDWSAAWRTWYMNQLEFTRPPAGARAAPPPEGWDHWAPHLRVYLTKGFWPEMLGRPPGEPRCQVPPAILKRALEEAGSSVLPRIREKLGCAA